MCLPSYTHMPLTLDGIEELHSPSIRYWERITRPIFAARSPLSNLDKLLNLWWDIRTLSQERFKKNGFLITLWIEVEK